jgi:RNA polymerase sigma-70 factor (ECF subfamily)
MSRAGDEAGRFQLPIVRSGTQPVEAAWRDHYAFALDLAFRMLGDVGEAEDAVQEAFTRLLRTDAAAIDDVRGWLVVVVSRICLDTLRSARVRRQAVSAPAVLEAHTPGADKVVDPADRVTLDDSVRAALLVVLEQLTPAERTVFVLHDVFGYQFDTVASIVGRSPAASRQLAARARRRVEAETAPARFEIEPAAHRALAERFIAACAGGDVSAVMELLDPDVVGRIDAGYGGQPQVRQGRNTVARTIIAFLGPYSGIVLVSRPSPGAPGVLAFLHGQLGLAFDFDVHDGLITHIEAVRDPLALERMSRQLGLRPAPPAP